MCSWLEFPEQLLVREPSRHFEALPLARGGAKTGVVMLLVRPYMRRRDRHADANVIRRYVEHHEIPRQRQRTIIVLADRPFDFGGRVEVVEEVVDDGEPRLDQREHRPASSGEVWIMVPT